MSTTTVVSTQTSETSETSEQLSAPAIYRFFGVLMLRATDCVCNAQAAPGDSTASVYFVSESGTCTTSLPNTPFHKFACKHAAFRTLGDVGLALADWGALALSRRGEISVEASVLDNVCTRGSLSPPQISPLMR